MKNTRESWFDHRPWIDEADADIDAYCREHEEPLFDLKAALRSWREDGLVIFRNAVPLDSIDAYLAELGRLIRRPSEFDIEIDHRGERKAIKGYTTEELLADDSLKLVNVHFFSDAARKLSLSKIVVSFLRHVFLDSPCAMQTLTFNKGSQQPPHADFAYVHYQTDVPFLAASWIPMEDIHADAGPLGYYPGTHKVSDFGFYDFGGGEITLSDSSDVASAAEFGRWLEREIASGKYRRKVFLPKKGDVLIWHAALAHEGTPIRNPARTRKSLVTHYTGKRNMPETHRLPDVGGKPQEFAHNGGVVLKHGWVDYSKQVSN